MNLFRPVRDLCVSLLAIVVIGCAKPDTKNDTFMPYPVARPTPIDQKLRDAANHELSVALLASDPLTRVHALEGIGDTDGISHRAEIINALRDPDAHVRFAAALAAGELKLPEAHDQLVAMAEEESVNVHVAVRYALHRLGDTHLSHELERLAADPNPLVRGNTAFVLGMLGEPSALKILRSLRDDPEAPVRQQASEAMWRLGDEQGMTDLISMSLSKHPDDQMIALIGLAMPRNTRVRQHIKTALFGEQHAEKDHEEWLLAVPLVAARALGMLGWDDGYGWALKGAVSSDPQLRTLAALAIGAIGRSDSQDILKGLLADKDAGVQIAAATAILQLKADQ
jgi:HEAT repeat protein